MPYQMHRIFCASPGDLEEERRAFYDLIGSLNEEDAMSRGLLLVPLSILPNAADKRLFQAAVSENIRSCSYYVQVLEDTWGGAEKNFERDYALALRCASDPDFPMQGVAVLFKKPLLPHRVEPEVADLKRRLQAPEFETPAEYRERLRGILSQWLAAIPSARAAV